MSEKAKLTLAQEKIFKSASEVYALVNDQLTIERNYLLGYINEIPTNFNELNCAKLLINICPNFNKAYRTFLSSSIKRREPKDFPNIKCQELIVDPSNLFCLCSSTLYLQAYIGFNLGYQQYLVSSKEKLKDVPPKLNSMLKEQPLLKNISENLAMSLHQSQMNHPKVKTSIEIIDHLQIKNRGATAQVKIAANLFIFFFGNYFKVTKRNQKYIKRITSDLVASAFFSPCPNHSKVAEFIKKSTSRAIKF